MFAPWEAYNRLEDAPLGNVADIPTHGGGVAKGPDHER